MRAITNTNIMVDDFDFCKEFPKNTFIHFITHFHQDHYDGLSTKWNYGPIFCTETTKKLILQKFTKVENITALEYNTKYTLDAIQQKIIAIDGKSINHQNEGFQELNEQNDKVPNIMDTTQEIQNSEFLIDVWAFNAFHIPGSAMYLFKGYMGTIFHTGDFRFNERIIVENPILFPPQLRNSSMSNISIHVDEMIFDNTYCNPYFTFPTADVVFDRMVEIISENQGKRVFIAMGALGKESICAKLSQYFQTLLIIKQEKLDQLKAIDYNTDIFTTDRQKGFIEIIRKYDKDEIVQKQLQEGKKDFICITTDFLMLDHKDPDGINYTVPYSLHSNWNEMKSLVKAITPSILRRLVLEIYKLPEFRKKQKIENVKFYLQYVKNVLRRGDSGYSQLKRDHSDITTLSDQFKKYMKQNTQQYLLKLDSQDKNLRRSRGNNNNTEEQQETDQQNASSSGKESYNQIAERMRATHNNKSLTSFYEMQNSQNRKLNNIHQHNMFVHQNQQILKQFYSQQNKTPLQQIWLKQSDSQLIQQQYKIIEKNQKEEFIQKQNEKKIQEQQIKQQEKQAKQQVQSKILQDDVLLNMINSFIKN